MQALYTFEQYDIVKKQRDKYYNQLTASEKRNGELVEALRIVKDYIEYPHTHHGTTRIRKAVEQALKNNKCTHEEMEMASATVGFCENCNENINLLGK